MTYNNLEGWKYSKANVFWAEIAPSDHVLQIYESDGVFLDALAGFVGGGINSNEACIVIATANHINALEQRLIAYGVSIPALIEERRYIPLDAEEMLSSFMVNGWPDEDKFNQTIAGVIRTARGKSKRKVRAFGEMVAILWSQGNAGATVNLEQLWNKFAARESFSLYCAYPRAGFTDDLNESMQHICCAHSKIIHGSEKQLTEVFYRQTP
jgi:hypothetical protein